MHYFYLSTPSYNIFAFFKLKYIAFTDKFMFIATLSMSQNLIGCFLCADWNR